MDILIFAKLSTLQQCFSNHLTKLEIYRTIQTRRTEELIVNKERT